MFSAGGIIVLYTIFYTEFFVDFVIMVLCYWVLEFSLCIVNVKAQQGLKISNSYKLHMLHINFSLHIGMLNYFVPFKISK